MRLICGILRLDGAAAETATLRAMAAAMTGPDLAPSLGMWLEGPMGLAVLDFGRRRGSRSPELPERDGWIVAADVRLDRGGLDPEAAVADAAGRHGPDFPDRLDGDLAVALWRRDRSQLLLGRDFIGARPLAWTWRPGCWFAFASLPKGLHGAGLASAEPDPVAQACRVAQSYFVGPDSGFIDIACLCAGHSLAITPDSAAPPRPHRAYRPDPASVGRWRGTPEEAAENLRLLLTEAVAARLPAVGPAACHLSGGLDSSAVTVLAAREARSRGGRILAVSMTSPTALGPPELDERPLIAAVLEQERDLEHALVHFVPAMPGMPQDPDWPGTPLHGHDDAMAAAAAAFGADRLLSGVGGDEGATYNGANLYLRLLRDGRLAQLARELPARARSDGQSLAAAIRGRIVQPLLPFRLRSWLRRRRGHLPARDPERGLARYLNPRIRDEVRKRRMPPILSENSPTERVRAFADHHIPSRCTYFAIIAARHGLAVSYPLLDRRVVDFMLSLPTHMFLADGQSRQPFRRAMRGILPDPVRLARHKVGVSDDPLLRYARLKPALLADCAALAAAPPRIVETIFDLDAVRAGLELLPDPDRAEAAARARAAQGWGGPPRWPPFMAIQALLTAFHLAGPSAPPAAAKGRPAC